MHSVAPRVSSNVFRNSKRSINLVLAAKALPIHPNLLQVSLYRSYNTGPASSTIDSASRHQDEEATATQIPRRAAQERASPPVPRDKADPAAWLALVESYLPTDLRARPDVTVSKSDDWPALQPISTLPAFLTESRRTTPLKLDLLSYLGTHENKWDCVIWLVKRLLEERKGIDSGTYRTYRQEPSPWVNDQFASQPLDTISKQHVRLEYQGTSHSLVQRLDDTTGSHTAPILCQGGTGLGQVWASTAAMILQATDLPETDSNRKTIMSHVLEILAHLHHIDALPSSIYTYNHAEDVSVIQKPPTLYLLAYRIMTILSDSAWKAHDKEIRREAQSVGAKDWYKGHEVPGPAIQPRVNELGTEVWLDLVLWCCVEGGWITEAAEIVMEMAKRKNKLKWRTIDFNSMSEPTEPKLNWSARVQLEIARSRMNQISGINIAGQSGSPPFVEMGPRTVSKEVILALMDALSNATTPSSDLSSSPTTIVRSLGACKAILGRSFHDTEESSLNRSILSIFESSTQASAGDLERILEMTPSYQAKTESQKMATKPQHMRELSAAGIGLLHRALYGFAMQGNLQGALRAFNKMQSLIDTYRRTSILEFAEDLKRREQAGDDEDDLLSESIYNLIPGGRSQIPVYVLVSLLDLITQTGQHDFGAWLLYSEEVDGPWIPQSLFAAEALQPALLRFAEATTNGELFAQVSSKLQPPLSPGILRTLLHCQIALGKWEAAEEIFSHFQSDRALGLVPEDIMSVAKAILRLEKAIFQHAGEDVSAMSDQSMQASALLQDILHGRYLPVKDHSQPNEYIPLRILTQIERILSSVPGSLGQLPLHTSGRVGRANAAISISTEAFNILLEGVAETQGSLEARKVWVRWCLPLRNPEKSPEVEYTSDERELVVNPSLQTLRVLMRPMVRAGESSDEQEKKVIPWAEEMCYRFGLTAKETFHELQGLLPKPGSSAEHEGENIEA